MSYRELVLGYELTTLKVRRDLTLLLLVRDILCGRVESTFLLGIIGISAPSRSRRHNDLFYIPRCRTMHFSNTPLHLGMRLFNLVVQRDNSIDIFYDNRIAIIKKIRAVLMAITYSE